MTLHTAIEATVSSHPTLVAASLKQDQADRCYRFLNGTIIEGFELTKADTVTQLLLYIGERFVWVSNNRPCNIDENRIVRNAAIGLGGKSGTTALLTRPELGSKKVLVQANTTFGRTPGTKYKTYFFQGLVSDGRKVAWCTRTHEYLYELAHGQSIVVFNVDGSVKKVRNQNGVLEFETLSILDQAVLRIENVKTELGRAGTIEDRDARCKREDQLFHHLVDIMTIGGKRSPAILETVFTIFEDAAEQHLLRPNVVNRIKDALRGNSVYALRFEGALSPTIGLPVADNAPAKPKGPPADRRAKLALRAQRDRERGQSTRGSSADQSQKGKGGKKAKN